MECRFKSDRRYHIKLRGIEMAKLKTKSSAKKRFSFTGTGLIKMGQAYKRHNMRKRNNRMLRQSRGCGLMHKSNAKVVLAHYFH